MKSSNPIVMVEAYRLLVQNMYAELGHLYPLHLGVTEAGDGEDGRIKSAMGIGTLLEEGIGDTNLRRALPRRVLTAESACRKACNRLSLSSSRGVFGPGLRAGKRSLTRVHQ